jgi:CheY-like chemotaxis protein
VKTFILENERYPLDAAVRSEAANLNGAPETLPWPEDYNSLGPALRERAGGVVLMPAVWEDLLLVKVLDQFPGEGPTYVPVAVGEAPASTHLASAFNAGLTGFVETPAEPAKIKQVLKRAAERWRSMEDRRVQPASAEERLPAARPLPHVQNQLLGRALVDLRKGRGPFAEGAATALLVTSSAPQSDPLRHALTDLGVNVSAAGGVTEAIQAVAEHDPSIVISDSVLPDGDAIGLARRMHDELTTRMPYLIVWSSSPEKTAELLAPRTYINDVILKPPPEAGIHSTLPSIVAGVYRALD